MKICLSGSRIISLGTGLWEDEKFISQDSTVYHNVADFSEIEVDCPEWVKVGDTYENGVFTAKVVEQPKELVPTSIKQYQCRMQLSSMGLYAQVNSAISGLGEEAQITWEYAENILRDNTLVYQMQSLLGKTDDEMDEFFIQASQL